MASPASPVGRATAVESALAMPPRRRPDVLSQFHALGLYHVGEALDYAETDDRSRPPETVQPRRARSSLRGLAQAFARRLGVLLRRTRSR